MLEQYIYALPLLASSFQLASTLLVTNWLTPICQSVGLPLVNFAVVAEVVKAETR